MTGRPKRRARLEERIESDDTARPEPPPQRVTYRDTVDEERELRVARSLLSSGQYGCRSERKHARPPSALGGPPVAAAAEAMRTISSEEVVFGRAYPDRCQQCNVRQWVLDRVVRHLSAVEWDNVGVHSALRDAHSIVYSRLSPEQRSTVSDFR